MNKKINLPELADSLAKKCNITKKEAEIFIREYFSSINDALIDEKLVKAKGIGTFKLTEVKDRESVDVTSGQRVVIPAHYKVSFTPDTQLSKTTNSPFALFEPVEINEQTEPDLLSEENDNDAFPDSEENEIPVVQSESKDDELIVEVNADNDLNDRDLNDETISEGGLKESHALVVDEEPILVEEDNVVDVPVSENNIEDLPASEDKIEETPLVEETIENDDNSEDKVEQEETKLFYEPVEAERKNEKNFPWLPIISVLLLIALAVVLIFIYKEEQRLIEEQSLYVYVDEDAFQKAYKDGAIDKLPGTQDDVQEEDSMIAPENEVDSLINSQAVDSISLTQNKTLEIEPQTASTSVNPEQVAPPVKVKESPEKTENTPKATTALKQRQLAAGETLRILAEKEFGSREFWVYIYLKNKAKIPNPNSVKVGTLLTIPDKTEYGGIDANDPNSIKRAKLAASKL